MALRMALVGCGRAGSKHAEALRRNPEVFTLAAVCDPDLAAAQRVAGQFGLPPSGVFTDYARLLRDVPLDAVDICTVHDQHHEQALAAIAAGRHVLLEKPMAITMQQCRDIVAAADAAQLTLMVAHNQRFMANYRALRNIIAAGELGAIRAMRAESHMRVVGVAPPEHWVFDGRRAGGGVAISLGLHRIDLLRYLGGEISRVVSATCKTFDPAFHHGAEDYVAAVLEFKHGGMAEIFATYSPWRAPWGETFVVYGAHGTAHCHPLALGGYYDSVLVASATRTPPGAKGRAAFVPLPVDSAGLPSGNPTVDELLHFAECIAQKREPLTSGREMLGTMQVVFAIYEAARRGAPVEIQ